MLQPNHNNDQIKRQIRANQGDGDPDGLLKPFQKHAPSTATKKSVDRYRLAMKEMGREGFWIKCAPRPSADKVIVIIKS